METLAAQPLVAEIEVKQKSFDLTASARSLRYDLHTSGVFQPETEQQVLNEELSLIVEGIGRASRTAFVIKREGTDLVYFNEGNWQSYDSMVQRGRTVAIEEAEADFRKSFLVDMAFGDVERVMAMRRLMPGQKMSWTSRYRHDLEELYGSKFMDDCGLVSARKMGYVYQATALEDGSILFESQTLDRSDSDAFSAIENRLAQNPDADIDELMDAHDSVLTNKYGQEFHAGRTGVKENAWEIVKTQHGLKKYLLNGLKSIASGNLQGKSFEDACIEHIYGVWATFKEVVDGNISFETQLSHGSVALSNVYDASADFYMRHQVHESLNKFISRGAVLVGCGGSATINSLNDLLGADPESVFKSIFKDKNAWAGGEPKKGTCVNCHKKNTDVGVKSWCKKCINC